MSTSEQPLDGRIALVAGATRGAGRGIARMLGEAGATVYCTGRSIRGKPASGAHRPETIEETAEMVTAHGGRGIAVRTDHTDPEQVRALIERIAAEQGALDLLVNDVWGGDALTEWKPFWEHSLENGLLMLERGLHSHIITARFAAPLMVARGHGLIVEITDGDSFGYRGTLYYDLVKTGVIRLAFDMAKELRQHGVTALAVTPGFLRSEEVLDYLGVAEENWRDGAKSDPHFIASETPCFVGRAIAALAADPDVMRKSGRIVSSWELSEEYGFSDIDGGRPHWGRYFAATFSTPVLSCDDTFYRYWEQGPMEAVAAAEHGGT